MLLLATIIPMGALSAEEIGSRGAAWRKVFADGFRWVTKNPQTSAVAGATGFLIGSYVAIPAVRQRINKYIMRNARAAREYPAVVLASGGAGAGLLLYAQKKFTVWGQITEQKESLLNYLKEKRAAYLQNNGVPIEQSVQNWISANPVLVTTAIGAGALLMILYILRSRGDSSALESALAVSHALPHSGVYKNIEKALLVAALEYNSHSVAQVRAAVLLCDNMRVQEMIIRVLIDADAAQKRGENPAVLLLPVIETIRAIAAAVEHTP